jgi:hypothetical protein
MRKASLVLACVLMVAPAVAFAQDNAQAGTTSNQSTSSSSSTSQSKESKSSASTEVQTVQPGPKFVRTLTNVQIELTLTDQVGTQAPEKKTVSMIVSSGNWGKVRSAGTVRPIGDQPFAVELNVDARPFVSMDGPIQLELTLIYSPPTSDSRETLKSRPTGMNQSLTVVLQSGKPLMISQAADPVSDRKVNVEVKATILK